MKEKQHGQTSGSSSRQGQPFLRKRDITPEFMEGYNRYLLERGLIRNSISQYNRVLRAVYNAAVKQGLPEKKRYHRQRHNILQAQD